MHQDLCLCNPNQVSGEEMPCLQGANSRLITGSEDTGRVVIYKSRNSLRSSSPWLSQAQLNWSKVWNRLRRLQNEDDWRICWAEKIHSNSDTWPMTLALFQEEMGRDASLWGWARDGFWALFGGPVAETPLSQRRGPRFDHWSGS